MSTTSPTSWDFRQFLSTPPPDTSVVPFHVPSEEEEEKLARLVEYFGREGYVPPVGETVVAGDEGKGDEKAQGLSDWEMMFLFPSRIPHVHQPVKGRNHSFPRRHSVE
ncbi:hypothetical protein QFC24_006495 [Naganishia onofrii]|uniref:Uncharacterized protein n=1 Tax=Naganishia onofrii TaxID=1851511 RepID=A0ACC2X035_9TREE|nr:hypothetical protein QFC24_006495 [Naganishia onofrii]